MCKLALFGAPSLECNGRPRPLSRRKARALLAYLAVTRQRHTREALVTLLWPDYDPQAGRADLSRMLSILRNALGAHHFLTDRESVALDEGAGLWVDVLYFRRHIDACRATPAPGSEGDCGSKLAAAVDLYQADFLAGFTLPGCAVFDEWQLLQTEALRRDLGWALGRLVRFSEADGDLQQAIAHAQRWVVLDPLYERAQRRLMALYARNGQRAAALRQYHACKRVLAEELGVEPQPETKQLYEQIRQARQAPAWLTRSARSSKAAGDLPFEWPEPPPKQEPPFVARAAELDRLTGYLQEALAGNSRVVFLTGGAGWGKTALLEAFIHRAQESHHQLVVAGGNGAAFAGSGDPYLPFREIMSLLTGDVITRATIGEMSGEQARRLWHILPETAQTLLEHGPQLLDVFVSGRQLLARATTAAPAGADWLVALETEIVRRQEAPDHLQQTALFAQFTNVLHHLAQKHPLLITLDDLQWIDDASIGLLFHLGRRLARSRILIVGAYRPDELPREKNGEPHPLPRVLDEFRRQYGDVFIDLAQVDENRGRAFVDALLDIEPNHLDGAFRQALFRRTEGHPLFAVELLRDMRDRGHLIRDEAGRWSEAPGLDWGTIPARIEAVIALRLDRLDRASREILSAAGVEGERFTAEVVARVLQRDEHSLLRTLSQELEKQHHLVREWDEVKLDSQILSSFRFSHVLFQQYVYRQLSFGERRRLHGDVARALAEIYKNDLDRVVVQLAHHHTAAAERDRAAPYWARAADLAYQKASLRDAARHYHSALDHWPNADTAGRAQLLCRLGECLWILGRRREAIETLEASHDLFRSDGDNTGAATAQRLLGRVYWEAGQPDRARQCYQQALAHLEDQPESEELAWALAAISNYHMHLTEYETAVNLGERALALARRFNDDALIIQCLCDLGSARSGMGDWDGLALERESLSHALALNRPHDAGRAYLYIAEGLAYLGRYDEARDTLEQALAYSRLMHVPYIAAGAARQLVEIDWLTGLWFTALAHLDDIGDHDRSEQEAGLARIYLSITLARIYNDLGQPATAHEQLARIPTERAESTDPHVAFLGELARAAMLSGRPAESVSAAAEILEWTDQARYLYPNVGMALLFICRAPVAHNHPQMVAHARSARQQLQRLDRQYRTPLTTACRFEAEGWLYLADAQAEKAIPSFQDAVARWQAVGHPYDQARALSGSSRALLQTGNSKEAASAAQQASALIRSLAAKIQDPTLKDTFLSSALARQIQAQNKG